MELKFENQQKWKTPRDFPGMGFSIKPDAGALLEMVKLLTMEFVQEIYVFTEVHTIFLAEDVIWEIIRDEAIGH